MGYTVSGNRWTPLRTKELIELGGCLRRIHEISYRWEAKNSVNFDTSGSTDFQTIDFTLSSYPFSTPALPLQRGGNRRCDTIHLKIPKSRCAPVAQLDRASDFESAGRPFESGRARQYNQGVRAVEITNGPILLIF